MENKLSELMLENHEALVKEGFSDEDALILNTMAALKIAFGPKSLVDLHVWGKI